jgi:hypothetical protein
MVPAGEFSAPKAECQQIDMSPRPSQTTTALSTGCARVFCDITKITTQWPPQAQLKHPIEKYRPNTTDRGASENLLALILVHISVAVLGRPTLVGGKEWLLFQLHFIILRHPGVVALSRKSIQTCHRTSEPLLQARDTILLRKETGL